MFPLDFPLGSQSPRGILTLTRQVLDLIGFLLFLIFVLVSSVILLRRENAIPSTAGGIE